MAEEPRQPRSIKIRPSILRKAHHRAIESQKRLGEWLEEAIEQRLEREKAEKEAKLRKDLRQQVFLESENRW